MRIFNTYGPRMQAADGRIVSNLINQALAGEPLTIYGSGEQTRSFCYVSDLIAGMRAVMDSDANPRQPVNLGNPDEFTINRLAQLVLAFTGSHSSLAYCPLPTDDPQRRRPDIARAAELYGWAPRVPLVEGLKATLASLGWQQPDEHRDPAPALPSVGVESASLAGAAAEKPAGRNRRRFSSGQCAF